MANWWASKASFLKQSNISKYILINIANEWGDWNMAQNTPTTWRDAYISAVSTIRNAGINTTLIIDAPNCGQDIQAKTLKNYALNVLNSDSKKNCLFAIHMYCEWSTSGGSNVTTLLPALKNAGIPVMVGEFGWEENNGSGGFCSIDATAIINTCQSNGNGWLAWSWSGNNTQESFLDMSSDWAGTSLTNWGNSVVNGSNGTKTAQTCSVFLPNLGTDIALNKNVSVSSTEAGSGNIASNLVDGNNSTRWSSTYADNQQVVIDLQGTYSINAMMLNWEPAYASNYSIQVSTDSTNWNTVYSTSNGNGGMETHTNLSVNGRYVKLVLTSRATQWGFSLYEIGVYGTLQTCSASITTSGDTTFCQGGNVLLNANSGTGYSYQWYNGATAISGQNNSSYTTSSSGLYSVKITNSTGCSATSAAKKVTVNPTPSAPSVTSSISYCQNASASALTATGASLKWYTSSTGGTFSTSAVPSTTVTGIVNYYVSQTSSGCESSRSTISVTVNPLPSATVSANGITTFCQGGSVTFSTANISGNTYQWYNGANTIAGQTGSSFTANTSGSYTVKVTNSSSCSSTSSTQTVNVNSLPPASIIANGPTSFCQGNSVTLNVSTGSGYTYQWYNGANAIAGQTGSSFTANTSGSYSVKVTNTSNCASTSSAQAVTVNSLPSASITTNGPTSFCQGNSVTLNASAGSGYTYQWYNGANAIAGQTGSSFTANTSGSYTVKVTNSSNCALTSSAQAVTVNSLPSAAITTNGPNTFCQGNSIILYANTGTGFTYQWYNGTNAIAGQTNSTFTANTSGSYSLQVTNSNNCSANSQGQNVTVINPLPTPVISTNGSTTICSGNNIILTANGSGSTYQWYKNGNLIAGEISSTYIATTSGLYSVVATGNCPSANSIATSVTVTPLNLINVSISVTDNSTCTGSPVLFSAAATGGGISYQWFKGGNPITGETNNTYNYNSNIPSKDTIYCQITSGNACTVGSPAFSNSIIETVSQSAVASVSITSNEASLTCSGTNVSFTAFGQFGGANPYYQWVVNGQNRGSNSSVFSSTSLSNGDQVACMMTPSLSCAIGSPATSAPLTVAITPIGTLPCANPATASINGPGNVSLGETVTYSIANPDAGSSYLWSVPVGASIIGSSMGTSVTISFSSSGGNITVTETTSAGAPFSTTTSFPVTISNVATSIATGTISSGIGIYPNPFSEATNLYISGSINIPVSIKIIDMTGIEVYASDGFSTNETINLGSNLEAGMYIVKVSYSNQVQTMKVVKSR